MKFYILHCAEKNPPQDSYMKTQTFETNTEKQVPIQMKKNGSVICDTDNTVLEKKHSNLQQAYLTFTVQGAN